MSDPAVKSDYKSQWTNVSADTKANGLFTLTEALQSQIIGALANEGGLQREDFGGIDIRPDFSLIELPVDLSSEVLNRLSGTRISGKLIALRHDGGPLRRSSGQDGPPRKPRQ